MVEEDDVVFDACYKAYMSGGRGSGSQFWDGLSKKYGALNGEALRAWFKRQMVARNMKFKSALDKEQDMSDRRPNVLLFDIETSPLVVYSWGLYDLHLSPENIIRDWHMISWSAKWLFDNETFGSVMTPKEMKNADDSRLVKEMWDLLEEADIVIAHNGNGFDLKKLNARFILNGLTPPTPYRSIDTLATARSVFGFTSKRLDYISKVLGFSGKTHTGMKLWMDCMSGDPDALKEMLEYNINDVLILEEVYLRMRPYIKSHPNLTPYYADLEEGVEICPLCGYDELKVKGEYTTDANVFEALRCGNCGGIARRATSELSAKVRKGMLRPTPNRM